MFKWLRQLFKIEIIIHVDGDLRLHHEGIGIAQGPKDIPIAAKSPAGNGGFNTPSEADIRPELFTDSDTPEISFGRDVELPPTRRADEGNKIS